MSALPGSSFASLVITNSFLEAEDLAELLTSVGFGPVLHARDIKTAMDALASSGEELRLMLFGLSSRLPEAVELLAKVDVERTPVLMIDEHPGVPFSKKAGNVPRPFTTDDILVALERLKR